MKLSTQEKHKIRQRALTMLSEMNDHMIEYGKSETTGTAVNEFTDVFLKSFENIPNTKSDQIIGDVRKSMRDIFREIRCKQGMTKQMQYLYDKLMGITKLYMSSYQELMVQRFLERDIYKALEEIENEKVQ